NIGLSGVQQIADYPFQAISAGYDFACGISNGFVYCWGGEFGSIPRKLPGGDTFRSLTADRGGSRGPDVCGLTEKSTLFCFDSRRWLQIKTDETFQSVSLAAYRIVGVTSRNELVEITGLESQPKVSRFSDLMTDPAVVSASSRHACMIDSNGYAWCWG